MKKIILILLALPLIIASCGDGGGDDPTPSFTFSTDAFEPGATVPIKYRCDGDNVSPKLEWSNPPEGTLSYAIIIDDPDAVPIAGFVWDHMVLYNLPVAETSLPEGVTATIVSDKGGLMLRNSSNQFAYEGPCPPPGGLHTYQFEIYALDVVQLPGVNAASRKTDLVTAMEGHILGETSFEGTFQR